jgi:V/A-type H+-transporting ATPase subunit B
MRRGAGPGRTRADHLDVAAQLLAALAHARQVGELAELVGEGALGVTDRRYLRFAEMFSAVLLDQRRDELRSLDESLARAWQLSMLSPEQLDASWAPSGPAP